MAYDYNNNRGQNRSQGYNASSARRSTPQSAQRRPVQNRNAQGRSVQGRNVQARSNGAQNPYSRSNYGAANAERSNRADHRYAQNSQAKNAYSRNNQVYKSYGDRFEEPHKKTSPIIPMVLGVIAIVLLGVFLVRYMTVSPKAAQLDELTSQETTYTQQLDELNTQNSTLQSDVDSMQATIDAYNAKKSS